MYEVKIYGAIISQHSKDEGQKGVTLLDLQNMLSKAQGQDIKVRFNSPGGDVQEGFAMYDELRRYATENNAKIYTYAESYLASIVTVPFLAGDIREISRTLEPFIHNAWMGGEGDSNYFKKNAEELERCNEKIARHYAEHTDLSYEEARELMNAETSITPKEAVKMRFATKIESIYRPVALKRFTNEKNNKMSNKTKFAQIMAIINGTGIKALKLVDADQNEVDFYELAEGDIVEVGAMANINGAPADGEVVMADGNTYVFVAGKLDEIIEATDPSADPVTTELEAALAKIAELEAENTQAKTENETILALNKTYKKALSNIAKLESEIVDVPTPERPAARTQGKPAVKGSVVASAIEKFKNLTTKK